MAKGIHQVIVSAGVVIAHVGTRAATVAMPNGSIRVELEDIRPLKELLDRVAKTLVKDNST